MEFDGFIFLVERAVLLSKCSLLAMIRWFSFFSFFAVFQWAQLGAGLVRPGLSFGLAIPVSVKLYLLQGDEVSNLSVIALGSLGLKEFLLGLVFGMLFSVPFWIADFTGGFLAGIRQEPDGTGQHGNTSFGETFFLIALGAFVFSGGFFAVLKLIFLSFQIWPVLSGFPQLETPLIELFTDLVLLVFHHALLLSAPFLFIWFCLDIGIGLVGRIARSYDLSAYADVIKAGTFLLTFILFTNYYVSSFLRLFQEVLDTRFPFNWILGG